MQENSEWIVTVFAMDVISIEMVMLIPELGRWFLRFSVYVVFDKWANASG